MKYFQFKKTLLSLAVAGIALGSCKKVEVPEDTGTKGQKIIGISEYGSLEPANFTKSSLSLNLSLPVVTLEMTLFYSGPAVFDKEVTATVAYDDAALTAFNAAVPAGGLKYTKMTSNLYSIKNPTVKFLPGSTITEPIKIEIYANLMDAAISYMLPISITGITGAPSDVAKSTGTSTAYLHVIGNPIAGNYKWDFSRWSVPDNAGPPDANSFTNHTTSFSAVNPNLVTVKSGYYIGPRYEISFTGSGTNLTNFKVKLNDADVAAMTGGGVTVTNGPNITKADPVTGEYIFWYTTVTRYVIDRFYK